MSRSRSGGRSCLFSQQDRQRCSTLVETASLSTKATEAGCVTMAETLEGTEFYMVEISSDDPTVTLDHVEMVVRSLIRTGDGVLVWNGRVFVAVVGDVPGAGKAARRLMGA